MNLKKQYKNLKLGAKRLFVGLLILSLFCTATGIGSIFAYAGEEISTASEGDSIFEKLEENGTGGSEGGEGGGTLGSAEGDTEDDEKLDSFVNDLIEGAGEATSEVSSEGDGDGNGDVVGTGSGEKSGDPVTSDSAATGGNTNPDGSTGSSSGAVDEKGTGAEGDGSPAAGGTASTASTSASTEETSIPVEGTTDAADGLSASTEGKTAATEGISATSDNKAADASGSAVSSASSDAVSSDASSLATSDAQLRKSPSTLDASKGASVEHVHDYTYSYTKKDDNEHYANCSCDKFIAEKHEFEDWKYDGDGAHKGTCICGATTIEKCTLGEDGVCTVCGNGKKVGPVKLAGVRGLTASNMSEEARQALEKHLYTASGSIEYSPTDDFLKHFASISGGTEWTERPGEYDIHYQFKNSDVELLNSSGLVIDDINSYRVNATVRQYITSEPTEVTYTLPETYSIRVNKKNIGEVTIAKSYYHEGYEYSLLEEHKNYVQMKIGTELIADPTLSISTVDISSDKFNESITLDHYLQYNYKQISSDNYDITFTSSTGSDVPIAGESTVTEIKTQGKGDYYTGSLVGKVIIEKPTEDVLYDGASAIKQDGYTDSVKLSMQGYKVSLDNSSWGDSVTYDTKCPSGNQKFYLYLKKGTDGRVFKIPIEANTFKVLQRDLKDVSRSDIDFKIDHLYTLTYPNDPTPLSCTGDNKDYTYIIKDSNGLQQVEVLEAGEYYTISCTGVNRYKGNRVIGFQVPSDINVLTYDGNTTIDSDGYLEKVTLASNSGYKISFSKDGTFSDSLEYNTITSEAKSIPIYFKAANGTRVYKMDTGAFKVLQRDIKDVSLSTVDFKNDHLYTLTYPNDTAPLSCTGDNKDYTYTIKEKNSSGAAVEVLEAGKTYTITFKGEKRYKGEKTQDFTVPGDIVGFTFNGSETKNTYGYLGKVTIASKEGNKISSSSDGPFGTSLDYKTITEQPQNVDIYFKMSDGNRKYKKIISLKVYKAKMTAVTKEYKGYLEDEPFKLTYTPAGTSEPLPLSQDEDYTYTIADIPSDNALVVGTKYTAKFTAKENSEKYEGEGTKEFTVSKLDVTYVGKQNDDSSYEARVEIQAPEGYKISRYPYDFEDSIVHNTVGTENVTVYLKKDSSTNNRMIKQDLGNITIKSVDIGKSSNISYTYKNYLATDNTAPYEVKYINGTYSQVLEEGTDYEIEIAKPSDDKYPIAGKVDGASFENNIKFIGIGGYTGSFLHTDKDKVNKIILPAQSLKFDGEALNDSKTYVGSVQIKLDDWEISDSPDDGTFSNTLIYDKAIKDQKQTFYVYLRRDVDYVDGNGYLLSRTIKIKQQVKDITILPLPYDFDSFFSTTGGAPDAAKGLVYNGKEQSLLKDFKNPKLPEVPEDVTLELMYSGTDTPTSKESDFQKTDAGNYSTVYNITYKYKKKDLVTEKILTVSKDYGKIEIAPKPISEVITPSSKLVTESSGNYDYVKSNVDFAKDAFTLTFNDKALVEGTEYTRTISPELPKEGELAPVGEHYAINYTGKGNFTGTAKYTVEVVDEDVTFNDKSKKEDKYPNKVKIGAPEGFTISLEKDGAYKDSISYDKIGESQVVTVYLKNKTTGKTIAKKITGLTITALTVLFDGRPTQNKFYYTSCRISADGYTVSYVNSEESKDYGQYYLANKAGKYPDFPLYFRDEDTGEITKVIISNLWIKKDIDLPVKYNGGTYREWFNTDVKLTCDGYEISESGKNNFKDYYLVTKDGVNTYTLDFRSKSDKADIQTFDIIIRIRRSMSGSMLIRVSSQDVNVTSSSDTKAAEEEAAAREKFQKYFDAYKNGEIQKTEDEELNTLLDAYKEGTITIDDVVEYYKAKDKSNNNGTNTSIVSDDYTSDEWKGDDSVSLITKEPRKISFEYNALTTDIDYILYTISEQFYSSVGDMEAEISEKSSVWRAYDDDARPTLPKNKKSYVYAKFYDTAGNCTTLSTGALIYDTVVPKMSTLSITSKEGTEGTIVAVAAKDTLSGVNKFKFKYEEKTKEKNPETPKKTDLNENGTVIEVSSESDGFSGGTYIVKDLDPDKTYVFFAIAIDRAGNISEVDRQEGQGVGGKKKEEEKKADSSLTPAPNGAAGGGDKQADAGSGSGAGAGAGAGAGSGAGGTSGGGSIPDKKDEAAEGSSDSGLGKNDREITRDPYIEDATGNVRIGKNETSGWTKITNEINSADQGATVYVQMSGTAEVPKEMIDSIAKRDVEVQFMVNDGVKWTVKSSDLANAQAKDVNMSVKMGSKGIPVQALNDLVGTKQHIEFGVQNPEDFGFNARITVPVGTSNRGMKATLYYYDTETKELKAKEESTVDENGNASFDLNTASECTIVLSPDGMLAAGTGPSASTELLEYYPDVNEELVNRAAITLPDLFSLNGNVRIWLFIIAFTSAALCIAILFMPSMQSDNDRRNSY